MATKRTCSECKFWNHFGPEYEPGACRAHPPIHTSEDGRGIWPLTDGEDWCGEFEPRKLPSWV